MKNNNIINLLSKLINQKNVELNDYKKKNDKKKINELTFKIRNFNNAVKIIKNLDFNITNSSQIKDYKGIGPGILSRITEILETNNLKELQDEITNNKTLNEELIEIEKLQSITGIGEVKAKELLQNNIKLETLLKEYDECNNIENNNIENNNILSKLSHHQIIGLKYYYNLKLQIPKKEIEKIEKKIKRNVYYINKKLEVIVCGSYRRQKEKSGDIDVLILHKDLKTEKDIDDHDVNYLKLVVETLKNNKIIVDSLTEQGTTKYMGICKLVSRSKGRRIDIRFMPYNSKASALLYFTGSGNFNKVMRLEAKKMGYLISEYGIYKKYKSEKKLIPTDTEEDIFKILNMEYKEPKDRI